MRRIAMATLAVLALAGCDATAIAGDTGTVTERKITHGRGYHFKLTVDADHGPKDSFRVKPEVYEACRVGDRWPACKRGAKK